MPYTREQQQQATGGGLVSQAESFLVTTRGCLRSQNNPCETEENPPPGASYCLLVHTAHSGPLSAICHCPMSGSQCPGPIFIISESPTHAAYRFPSAL